MQALEPVKATSPLWCKALHVPMGKLFLYICARKMMCTEFAPSAAWKKDYLGQLEVYPNVHPLHSFLQGLYPACSVLW